MLMNDDDFAEDLAEWLKKSPEDRYEDVKEKLDALNIEFSSKPFRIEEDIFNAGLDIIKNGILVIYCSLHDEHQTIIYQALIALIYCSLHDEHL